VNLNGLKMDIFSFGCHFTDEKSCRLHFKEQRDKEGVVCLQPLWFNGPFQKQMELPM